MQIGHLVHKLPVALSLVMLLVGLAALAVRDSALDELAPPSIRREDAVRQVQLSLPPIEPFLHYYGTKEDQWAHVNPFVPFQQRQREQDVLASRGDGVAKPLTNERVVLPPPPPKLPEMPPFEPPALPEMPAALAAIVLPNVVGYEVARHQTTAYVRFGDDEQIHAMHVGDVVSGWTLRGRDGQLLMFEDVLGELLRIGVEDVRREANVVLPAVDRSATAPAGDTGDAGASGQSPAGSTGSRTMSSEDAERERLANQLLAEIRNNPVSALYLEQHPELIERIKKNPMRARKMFKRLMRENE